MKGKIRLAPEFKPKLWDSIKTYTKEKFFGDLMSGIIVGIVALPLAIAFGIASGVSPEKEIVACRNDIGSQDGYIRNARSENKQRTESRLAYAYRSPPQ